MKRKCLALTVLVLLNLASSHAFAESLSSKIEAAHGGEIWNKKKALRADIQISFGGSKRLGGQMIMNTSASKSRFELDDDKNTVMVFDGEKAWVTPENHGYKKPRFELLTWPYFLAAPFKLDDQGAYLKKIASKRLMDKPYTTSRLTFGEGVGDSPDDWYVVYSEPSSNQLRAMAYIVTYGADKEAAESKPHAIVYSDPKDIEGVTIYSKWIFYNWSEQKGVFGNPIGEASLDSISFIVPESSAFIAPEGSIEDPLP